MIKIVMTEGLGDYKGIARNKSYNPNGRMGALLQAYVNDELVYETGNASTLPDSISTWYADAFNGGDGIPCICEGEYELYTKMHMGKHKAFEIGAPGTSVPVIRDDKESTSSGLNVHYRKADDPNYFDNYASSTGCPTVLEGDLMKLFSVLGITDFNSKYVGSLIVKRKLPTELYNVYLGYYPKMIDYFSFRETEREYNEDLKWLVDNKGYNSIDYWQDLIDKGAMMSEVSVETMMSMIRKSAE